MEIQGKVKFIGAEMQVSASFRKRELVVSTDEEYVQHISINFVQDKTELLDRFTVGDEVKVSINLRGREWVNPQGETKYFNDIQGWRIDALNSQSGTSAPTAEAKQEETYSGKREYSEPLGKEEEENDVPF
jgi:translation initiation factor IF-3